MKLVRSLSRTLTSCINGDSKQVSRVEEATYLSPESVSIFVCSEAEKELVRKIRKAIGQQLNYLRRNFGHMIG